MLPAEYEELISQIIKRMTNSSQLIEDGEIKSGSKNKWEGKSGFHHQIDVSLENQTDVLLAECKFWTDSVPAEAFLTLWARVLDISRAQIARGRKVRGALVTTKEFQSGVYSLANEYKEQISLFLVSSIDDFEVKMHSHFIKSTSIPSGEKFGTPTITQTKP